MISEATGLPVGTQSLTVCVGKLRNTLGRLLVHELFFEVPRDHDRPTEDSLRLFARSVERNEKPVLASQEDKQRPWFLYLQGGPGFGCKSPASIGWVDTVLDKGYKVGSVM